ncbi:hypothetical protein CKO15_13955, partial [Halorhodospira abdelmalekii]|nr:hypothetical protein [Halorhodospira abdelmalekii]
GANPLDLGKVELRVIPPDEWHDMSAVDVLVGVRSFDRKQYPSKPPSKMIHAWRSGIPFIGGWDSAYSAVARPGAEYIRVASITELRSEIRRLAENPACYDRLVEKGRRRAPEFSHEAIAGLWLSALDGPVQTAFEVWLEKNGRSRGWIRHRADVVADVASQVKSR